MSLCFEAPVLEDIASSDTGVLVVKIVFYVAMAVGALLLSPFVAGVVAEAFVSAAKEAAEKWGKRAGNIAGFLFTLATFFSKFSWWTPKEVSEKKRKDAEAVAKKESTVVSAKDIGRFVYCMRMGERIWGRLDHVIVDKGYFKNPTTGTPYCASMESIKLLDNKKERED